MLSKTIMRINYLEARSDFLLLKRDRLRDGRPLRFKVEERACTNALNWRKLYYRVYK